ncbi:HlyD family secretion protein [Nitratifractor salsuginis]|uniref:Secretion protein HlyD family protein n=1 Tax=Nitratifractor salsuginis (strain DSM 16511 / JCM 12458 / E9I37-1) TaxID=749222 RepID=E6X3C2_NITSE|nr:HlyD family efflux transporter periplasmic adaptor subunit [Nitratifractor salsuginis]ADV47335.1 secretion protein HlyD family protein [Nitratifractor salsuginis DSM 16511]
MSKKFGSLLLLLLVLILVVIGYRYIHYRTVNAVSDAAFIKSDRLATLSFKVGGKVIEMKKEENRAVHKGELLARIDPTDFLTAKTRMTHRLEALEQKIEAASLRKNRLEKVLKLQSDIARNDVNATRKNIDSMALKIAAAKVRLAKLQKDLARFADLLAKRLIEGEKYETVKAEHDALVKNIEAMEMALDAQKENLKKAQNAFKLSKVNEKEIAELSKTIASLQEQRKALHSAIEDLDHKIAYTRLYAPFDGIVAKKFFDAPKVIKKGSPVYAITDPKALYCEVLLSEKKMKGVQPGNRVEISVDALEGKKFEGSVESIAPTSASTFSLVPRDIASGEFTKLDQRFNVRIRLKELDPLLRAGMGATVAIERK